MKEQVTLFMFPFAGGNKYSLNALARHFKPPILVKPVEWPGRGSRIDEPLEYCIDDVVDDVFDQIADQLKTPYAFYGHSMGSLVAYLLAKKISRSHLPLPLHLFVSGRGGPSVPDLRDRHRLPSQEFWQMLRNLGGMPDEVFESEALMEFFEPILRADFQCIENYVYVESSAFSMPITSFNGMEDSVTAEQQALWQIETSSDFTLHQLPGGHFFIFNHLSDLARTMTEELCRPRLT